MKSSLQKKESGRVPFTDSKWSSVKVEMELRFYHTKSQWSSEPYLNSISSQPQHPDSPRARPFLTADRPPQQPRPHTIKRFCCSTFPIPNVHINLQIKRNTTTMSSINLHNAKKNDLPDSALLALI